MKISMSFIRFFFLFLSIGCMTAFMLTLPIAPFWQKICMGLGGGIALSTLLVSLEIFCKKYSLKAFNTVALGLFAGYLMGQGIVSIFIGIINLSHIHLVLQPQTIDLIKVAIFLLSTYLGIVVTLYFSNEILISIPFLKPFPSSSTRKDFLIDANTLADPRILDLAGTGLIDKGVIIPRSVINELYAQLELSDEGVRCRARQSIDILKKLETMPALALRIDETPGFDKPTSFHKLLRLAKLTDSHILTSDISQINIPPVEGVNVINIHSVANALRPIMHAGETIRIKIQRYGKEPHQGIGYLDDGTMVVVNGGGDFIFGTVDAQVLSVKHTSSGRMIFCNTIEQAIPKPTHSEA